MSGPTYTEGEHTFPDDLLVEGEKLRSYTAGEELTRGEPVEITGDYEVSASTGDAFNGIVMYSAAAGKQVPVAEDDDTVKLEISAAISSGDALTSQGDGTFAQTGDGETQHAIAKQDGGDGDWIDATVTAVEGNEEAA